MHSSRPYRLGTKFVEKVWGASNLAPWYPNQERKIGEVWFTDDEELPLLVKFIFTEERLSVQVHPGDAYAAKSEGGSRGKTEMWHILRTRPGANIAAGFRESLTRERAREAALSGEIEGLLEWVEVQAGDTFFTPAGTVHAIGAGLALCEIQQNSDVTYRLFDYGRPRELHIEKALDVAELKPHAGPATLPVSCEHFSTEALEIDAPYGFQPRGAGCELLIVLSGAGLIAGEPYAAGQTWRVPAGCAAFRIEPQQPTRFLKTCAPPSLSPDS